MHCNNPCPIPVTAVARAPVNCGGKCGKQIKGHLKYCPTCSNQLKRCEQCGKVTKKTSAPKKK